MHLVAHQLGETTHHPRIRYVLPLGGSGHGQMMTHQPGDETGVVLAQSEPRAEVQRILGTQL